MLNCRQMMDLMTDYLEGELGLFQRVWFEIHVGTCWQCRQYLAKLRATLGALGSLEDAAPPPPEVMDQLLERFQDWRKEEPAADPPRSP
jgi:predicted anti-sigma-YlaC factor YlaD